MSSHPITDIHDTEKEARKSIEQTQKNNDKMVVEAREKEEKKLMEFVESEKSAGKELIQLSKEEASEIAKTELSGGEREISSTMKEAEMRKDQAVRTTIKAFTEHVGI